MKCPFKIIKKIEWMCDPEHTSGDTDITESFAECDGDECPFFYKDDDDVDHCARCDGGPREEEL